MKYLFLVYEGPNSAADKPEMAAFVLLAKERTNYIFGGSLEPPEMSVSVRTRNRQIQTAVDSRDEPGVGLFLAAFYVLHAVDLNDAIRIGATMPLAQSGAIDIRPLTAI